VGVAQCELYDGELTDFIERAHNVTPWLVHPNKQLVAIGNSDGRRVKVGCPDDAEIYTVNGQSIIFGDYIDSGYFSLRTPCNVSSEEASQIFITGIANIERQYVAHKHADELSFELFHNGRLIFVDSGKYSI
jgi:hypothetical protein